MSNGATDKSIKFVVNNKCENYNNRKEYSFCQIIFYDLWHCEVKYRQAKVAGADLTHGLSMRKVLYGLAKAKRKKKKKTEHQLK